MPTYEYRCSLCEADFDVVKSIASIERTEECPACGHVNKSDARQVSRSNLVGLQHCTESAYHDPALGVVVKDRKHAARIAKDRGYIEVGNEKPETIHKHFETQRKETREQRWKDADRVMQHGD